MTLTLELNAVTRSYGRIKAVDGISFSAGPGEGIALVGHNGAGKTTLMKLMLGLARPSAGSIAVLGQDPAAGDAAVRRRLGYLPETVSFHPALTGRETLRFYARLKRGRPGEEGALLERLGLTHAADRRIGTYSKGMRQRLGLAQAMIGTPAVLLLDEPTTGLDPELRQQFYVIVREMRAAGATVLLSSHALNELEGHIDRVVILNRGHKIADGSLDALRHIARLPARLRLRTAQGGAQDLRAWMGETARFRHVNGDIVEFDAAPDDKAAFLRRVTTAGVPFEDIDIVPPGFDELYAHFLAEEASR